MSEAMDVTARLRGDNASFDGAQKRSAEVAEATSNAMQRAAKKAADAQAFAAKFASDTVDSQSVRVVQAMAKQRLAQQEYARIQGIAKAGYLGEADAAKVTAAAYQRLAEAKLIAARAGGTGASEHAFASIRESIGGLRFGEAFQQVQMVAGIAALVELASKMRETVSSALEFGEAMERASEKTGLAVKTLSTVHYAAAVTGGDFDSMTSAVGKMEKTIAQATEGSAKAQELMRKLGLNAKDLAGRTDGAEVAFQRFMQVMAATDTSVHKVQLAFDLVGKAGQEQIPMLVQLGDNWDVFQQKAAAAGVLLDEKSAKSLAAMNERLKELKQNVAGAGLAFTDGLMPGMNQFLNVVSSGRTPTEAFAAAGERIAAMFNLASAAVSGLVSGMFALDALASGGKLTAMGRDDLAKMKEWNDKASQFREAMVGGVSPKVSQQLIPAPKPKGGGFEGIGDLNAAAEARKAAEKQMQSFEDMLNKRKADEQIAVVDEINFWEAMLAPAQKYPENLSRIYEKLGSLTQEYYRQLDSIAARAVEAQKRAQQQMQQQNQQMLSMMKQWEEQDSRRATAQAKLTEAQQRSGDAAMEQAIKFQVMTGQLSKHDAALQLAAIHTADYRAQLEELDREAAEDATRSTLTPDERDTRAADRDIRRVDITGAMNRTSIDDQQQIQSTTALGGATDALRDFTASATDAAKQMQEFVSTTLASINDAILGDKRGRWKQAGASVLKQGSRSLLQEAEGTGLKALGISDPNRKPKGTASDPIYVLMAKAQQGVISGASDAALSALGIKSTASRVSSAVSGGAGSAISGIAKMFGSFGGSAAGGVASGVGGAADAGAGISDFLSGLSFFANGTPPLTADTMAMVGERGPEIVNLPRGSSVTPNSAIPNLGSTSHQYFIDARGATDPAQIEASVHRTMQQYVPGIVHASVGASRDAALRKPRTSY